MHDPLCSKCSYMTSMHALYYTVLEWVCYANIFSTSSVFKYFKHDNRMFVSVGYHRFRGGSFKHRLHRVTTAAFWRTFIQEGKISPGCWEWGVHAHPLSLHLPSPVICSVRSSWVGRQFFRKFAEIFAAQGAHCTTGVVDTDGKWKKS